MDAWAARVGRSGEVESARWGSWFSTLLGSAGGGGSLPLLPALTQLID